LLFLGTGTYDAKRVRPQVFSQPRFQRPDAEPEYETVECLWWRKEDHPARQPKDVSEGRDKIVLAYKMDEARRLAPNAANAMAAEINKEMRGKKWTVADVERYLREQKAKGYNEPFELDHVAQFVLPPREVAMMMRVEYRPYEIPPDKQKLMPYAPVDLVD